jgi:choloylglycine hydrolase
LSSTPPAHANQKNLVSSNQTDDKPALRSLNFDQFRLHGGEIRVMPLDQPAQVTELKP